MATSNSDNQKKYREGVKSLLVERFSQMDIFNSIDDLGSILRALVTCRDVDFECYSALLVCAQVKYDFVISNLRKFV